ncbi:MAG: bifunctional DNA-formamidopyrimidine glycosylase/DNA-(apurinic or apyrimidinic site) lyase [Deltaproteobacteria bacterium]|nr:bifunctional DNA-formamidopyrimidine glycosylase/DNA-(apurinic or apyrimidinic site) lyase [Deltaproteobacteria bacterium]
MPELPEVEVIRRGLAARLVGRRFLKVSASDKPLRQQSPLSFLQSRLAGNRLTAVKRKGKYLLFILEDGSTLLVHLGMTGRLMVGEPGALATLPHVHLRVSLDNGLELVFQDVRRFGRVLLFEPGVPIAPLAQVGRDPFSRAVTAAWLAGEARGRLRPLKNFLLDGRILAGLGNIYACEILFAAGLHPETPAGRLSLKDWERVLKETRRILAKAIRRGGTTVNDYLNSQGETGLFQFELMVYGRAGEPCRVCGTPIRRLVQAGRSTFFCPACQKLKRRGRQNITTKTPRH